MTIWEVTFFLEVCVFPQSPEIPDFRVITESAFRLASSLDSISIVFITRLQKSLKHMRNSKLPHTEF